MTDIEVIGAAPLTRRTLWHVRMADHRQHHEVWVTFGMEVDKDVPGLIRMFPTKVSVQTEDQAPPSAFIDITKVREVPTAAWVKRAFALTKKKASAREDYLALWDPAPARLRVILESPKSRP